jgi:hypothetical protein
MARANKKAQIADILDAMETVAPDKFTYDAMDDESLIHIRGLIRDGMASGKYTAPVYQTALDDVEKAMMRRGLDITARRRAQAELYNLAVEQGKLIGDRHGSEISADIQDAIVMMKQSGDINDPMEQQEAARGLFDGVRLKLQEKKLARRTAATSGQEMAQDFLLRYVPDIENMAQGIVHALEYAPGGDDFNFDSWQVIHDKAQAVAMIANELKDAIQNAQFD